jgi:hypothetical protein
LKKYDICDSSGSENSNKNSFARNDRPSKHDLDEFDT